jgi:hypothetical protein
MLSKIEMLQEGAGLFTISYITARFLRVSEELLNYRSMSV